MAATPSVAGYTIRKRGKRYYLRYRNAADERDEVRLQATSERAAHAEAIADYVSPAHRSRNGLEKVGQRMTLDALWRKREPVIRGKKSFRDMKQRYFDHVSPTLGAMMIDLIEPADVEALMATKQEEGLEPRTAEHLRVLLSAMFSFAIKKLRILRTGNPAQLADRPKLVQHLPRFLEKGSIPLMLRAAPWWTKERYPVKALLAALVYLGLRKGEALGLKPGDVDLGRMIVWVSRSYDEATTKDGKAAPAGIPPELVPYLQWALENCRGEWLFSKPDGSLMGPNTKVEVWLRKALRDAGLIQGFDVWCVTRGSRQACLGRDGKPYRERRQTGERIPCPRCGRAMWAKAIPLDLSTKDMRSTWTTHFIEATGDIDTAARQLRHSSADLTRTRYRFARDSHLVEQVARLAFEPVSDFAHRLPPNQTEQARLNAEKTLAVLESS